MKTIAILLGLCLSAAAQGINTKVMDASSPTKIYLSLSETTTLQFPNAVTGVYGLGIVPTSKDQKAVGMVQFQQSEDKKIIVLHALSASKSRMTVRMGDKLYVLDFYIVTTPDVATTLTRGSDQVKTATVKDVLDSRPKYDHDLLLKLIDFSREEPVLRPKDSLDYKGYSSRECSIVSDDGTVKTEVKKIHSWKAQDAIVLEAVISNNGDEPLLFDQRHMMIAIGQEVHPVTAMNAVKMPIPPKSEVPVFAEVVGDYDGSRANFDIGNEYRLVINTGYHISAATPTPMPIPSPTPVPKPKP